MKNTIRKGVITETKIILKLLELGYNIFTPFGDGSKCDIIIQDSEGNLYKIQSKTSRIEKGREVFNAYSTVRTRSTSGKKPKILYTNKDVDYFCTFDSKNNFYMIPLESINVLNPCLKHFEKYICEVV